MSNKDKGDTCIAIEGAKDSIKDPTPGEKWMGDALMYCGRNRNSVRGFEAVWKEYIAGHHLPDLKKEGIDDAELFVRGVREGAEIVFIGKPRRVER